jgi:hypothetical protein
MLKALANGLCLEASWQGVKLPSKGKSLAHRKLSRWLGPAQSLNFQATFPHYKGLRRWHGTRSITPFIWWPGGVRNIWPFDLRSGFSESKPHFRGIDSVRYNCFICFWPTNVLYWKMHQPTGRVFKARDMRADYVLDIMRLAMLRGATLNIG